MAITARQNPALNGAGNWVEADPRNRGSRRRSFWARAPFDLVLANILLTRCGGWRRRWRSIWRLQPT